MDYLWIVGELAAIAAICGLVAGSAPDRTKLMRNFLWLVLIGVGMALILAAVAHYQPGWIKDMVQPWVDKLRQCYWNNKRFMIWWIDPYFGDISGNIIWPVSGLAVWLAWGAGVIAFNCRRAVKSWWAALPGVAAAVVISYYLWFWGYAGLGALVILFSRVGEKVPWGAALIATVVANSLLLTVWTLYSFFGKHKGWRVLVSQLAIWAGCYLLCWGGAFVLSSAYAKLVKYQAAKAGIAARRVVPYPGLPQIAREIDKIRDFHKQHPLFQLPVDSTYDWKKWRTDPQYAVPAKVREYTLQHFNSPETREYYQYYDNILNADLPPDTYDEGLIFYLRNCTRMWAGLAALYLETGEPDKVLPQMLKITAMDQQKLADLSYVRGELTRVSCRMIWYIYLVSLGPDGPQYAPYYRQALNHLKAQKVCFPDDAGVYLAQLDCLKSENYPEFLALPGAVAFSAKRLAYFMSIRPELQKLKEDGYHGEALPWDVLDIYKYLSINSEVSLLLGRTGVALKLYRSEEGKYPATLAELVPKYLDQLPVSPFPDAPLIYRLDGNDFTLSIKVPPYKYPFEVSSQQRY